MGSYWMPNNAVSDFVFSDSPLIWIGFLSLFIFVAWGWHQFTKWFLGSSDDTSLCNNRPASSDTTGDGKGDTFGH